jgi:hypothetical protein
MRPRLAKPYFDGVDICATDARLLLRVNPEAAGMVLPIDGPKRLVFQANCNEKFSVEELKSVLTRVSYIEEEIEVSPAIKCEECDGNGFVQYEYVSRSGHHFYEDCGCPYCQGSGDRVEAVRKKTGRKIPEWLTPVRIGNSCFDARRLLDVADTADALGVDTIAVVTKGKMNDPSVFRFNADCELVIMPMYNGDDKFDIQHVIKVSLMK